VREEQVGEVFVLSFESSFPHETEEVEELHHKVQDALSRGHARFVVNLQGPESSRPCLPEQDFCSNMPQTIKLVLTQ
jgi:hypothetical protein